MSKHIVLCEQGSHYYRNAAPEGETPMWVCADCGQPREEQP